jgi:hypothetical protein
MSPYDSITIFGLFIIFLGLGLLIYATLLGLFLRLHFHFFPEFFAKFDSFKNKTPREIDHA